MDAGRLRERIKVLAYRQGEWAEAGDIWGSAARSERRNLFSTVGIGARSVEFVVRKRPLTLHNAFRWRGMHCFLTSITEEGRGHLRVMAALIEPVPCSAYRNETGYNSNRNPVKTPLPLPDFFACVTEKYMGHIQQQPQAQIHETLVLVAPKAVELRMGDVVDVGGRGRYHVTLPHFIDEFKNEYEALRVREG